MPRTERIDASAAMTLITLRPMSADDATRPGAENATDEYGRIFLLLLGVLFFAMFSTDTRWIRILVALAVIAVFLGTLRATGVTKRRMRQAVSELFGEEAVLFKDKVNFKLPGGDGFKEHQDVQAGWDDFADLHITAKIAIDETNEENGSLEMIAGMHRQGVLGSMWAPLTDEDTGHMGYVQVHCLPGDAVFFDSYAPHRSHPNRSDQARRVLYITYNRLSEGDSRARYYADKHRNFPPDIERDPDRDYSFKV